MNTKRTILFLKTIFVVLILLCVMQSIFTLSKIPVNKLQISLFALRIPVEITDVLTLNSLRWYILACAIPLYSLFLFVIAKLIRMLQPLSEGRTPFTSKSVLAIKHIGYACFIYAIISTIVEFVGAQLLLSSTKHAILNWNTELTAPINSIVVGMIVLSLAKVFAQGLLLKEDNDSIV